MRKKVGESLESDVSTRYENGYISQVRMNHGDIGIQEDGRLYWETVVDVVATYNGKSAYGMGVIKNWAKRKE